MGQGGGSLRGQEVFAYKVDQGNVFVWNEQPATAGSSGSDIPAAAGWRIAGFNRTASFGDPSALPAGPASVAVGPNGKPWFIGSGGAIYTSVR